VAATAAGRVVFAGRTGDYGRMVVIDHGNGFETLYAHLARISVRAGERVRRGELVGRVGKSGNATGYHLHYEIRKNGRPIDPKPFMDE
jgi:murein DD-endopeptidase MepM/ murein hydrolase activator NlpD